MLVNTILIERTLAQEGLWDRMNAADRRGLTPLFHGHINPYGQFALDLAGRIFWTTRSASNASRDRSP
jgi:hypothetical protein